MKIMEKYRQLLLTSLIIMLQCLGVGSSAYAESRYFTRITSNDGLSENCVKSIVQDHLGFIWLGTRNGLNRYAYGSIKHYDVDDLVKKQGNHNISALFEDSEYNIWIGTDKGVYIYNPYTELFSHFDVKTDKGEQITNWVNQIVGDSVGNIWVVVPNQGAFRYNVKSGSLKMFRTAKDSGTTQQDNTQSICVRRNGEVWIGTNGAGIYWYDTKSDRLVKQLIADDGGHTLTGKNIYAMCEYGDWLIIGEHEDKLMKFNPSTNVFREVNAPNVHYKVIRSLACDGNELFVGTQDGLFIIDETKNSEIQIKENDILPFGLSDNMIYSLLLDRNKGLWVGTMMSGACYMPRRGMVFSNYLPMRAPHSLSSKRIREMQLDGNGDVWIANEESGIDVFHPRTKTFDNIVSAVYKGGSNRLGLMVDGDQVWSGIFKNGLDIINVNTHAVRHYTPDELGLQGEGSVSSLLKDSKGNIWLGTLGGIYMHSGNMRFTRVSTIGGISAIDMVEDRNGNIWLATGGTGVFCINPKTMRHVQYLAEEGKENTISSNSVSSITVDHAGNLWFSTDRGGICMYDISSGRFTTYSKNDGLPDDVAYKILEDKHHYLWFGTDKGLVRFKPDTKEVTVYKSNNGLLGNQYNYKSAAVTRDGMFLFGGPHGLVAFDPLLAGTDMDDRKVYITNLRINNQEVHPEPDGILKSNILHTKEIRLPHDISNFSLDFASLYFSGIESCIYEYMLDGVDSEWNITPNGQSITYSQLPPGEYTFKVRTVGDKDNVTELTISVLPPWWATTWAFIVYLIAIVAVVYVVWLKMRARQEHDMEERQTRFVEEKDKELLKAKISFFTDITHEIRTPLTLINGSMENIDKIVAWDDDGRISDPKAFGKNIRAIDKNCKRLLNLTNQLLDFRKIDNNGLTLNFVNFNISNMMEDIVSRFEPTINRMNKTISLDLADDNINIAADVEAVTKIVSNLLNNARKYSETFIQVTLTTSGEQLELRVTNDGSKIPPEKAEDIFKPFVQLDESHTISGSGLGLPMARSLAEMHGGHLSVNTASEYNEFVLTLPMKQEHVIDTGREAVTFAQENFADDVIADEPQGSHKSERKEYSVLVVEDNAEVIQMVADNLRDHYNVLTACNGSEGLKIIHREHVDMVISDVMMPVMDGYEMCRQIKNDIEISHIPVILLTARQALESRIGGLKAGADAYIEKPFSFEHLHAQIETLIANRKRERESFVHKPYLPVQSSAVNKQEEEFMSRISDLIVKNIKQPEFNVEQLAAEMCMSRSSLHRKIKEVSNQTPIDFIRLIRLKKAAELIKEHGYRSSEVCEMVGISSPSYFIKLFQKQFGMTPKQFASRKD